MSDMWVEATTEDGKKFYYHKVTRVSVWEKPSDSAGSGSSSSSSSTTTSSSGGSSTVPSSSSSSSSSSTDSITNTLTSNASQWKEYTTESGKSYYHNTVTGETKWDIPIELISSKTAPSNQTNGSSPQPSSSTSATSNVSKSKPILNERDNAIKVFKELLMDKDIPSTWSFERATKSIINDDRYQVLKTMAERKQIFQDYLVERKKYEYEEKRKKDRKSRDDFIQLLKDSGEVTLSMSWRHASLYFDGDPRWEAVDIQDREPIFKQYLNDMDRKEREEKEIARRDLLKQIRLKFENNLTITVKSQWRKVKEEYENDALIQSADKFDVLQVYESYIRDLEKKEDEASRADKEKLYREARVQRDNFRDLLNEKYKSGEIHAYTRWKEFYHEYKSHPVVETLSNQVLGSTPLELFSDFKEDMEIAYEKDFKRLKDLTADVKFKFQPNQTTLDNFRNTLSAHEKYSTISPLSVIPFFEYLKEREEKKAKDAGKKRQRDVLNFKEMLEDTKSITKHSKWQDIKPLIMKQPEYIGLEDEQEKEKIFKDYLEFLDSREESDEEGIIKSEEELSQRKEFSSRKRSTRDDYDDRKKKERKP